MKEKFLIKARELFNQFNQSEISLSEFKDQLIKLTYDITDAGIWEKGHCEEFFIPDYIEAQFESYQNGQKYLLSRHSSGSLLQQFEMGLE